MTWCYSTIGQRAGSDSIVIWMKQRWAQRLNDFWNNPLRNEVAFEAHYNKACLQILHGDCVQFQFPFVGSEEEKTCFRASDKDGKLGWLRDVSPSQGLLQSEISRLCLMLWNNSHFHALLLLTWQTLHLSCLFTSFLCSRSKHGNSVSHLCTYLAQMHV